MLNYVTASFQVFNTLLQLFFTVAPRDVALPMFGLNTAVFAACLALVFVNGPEHPDLFFFSTVGSALLLGLCCAGISTSVFGMAGTLPPAYMQAVMSGQALGGVICALALVSFSSMFPAEGNDGMSKQAAVAYFVMALVVLIAAGAGCFYIKRHPFFMFHTQRARNSEVLDSAKRIPSGSLLRDTLGKGSLLRETWPLVSTLALGVGYNFAVTLAIFPAVTVDVYPYTEDFAKHETLWIGFYCFLLFNVGDWAGRLLAGWVDSC
eukprot:COSAG05_NODE_7182_length_845_cov_2.364611_1_plen_263_part_01